MNRLRELREGKEKPLNEVAKEVGIAESQLSFYERGKRRPKDMDTWRKLADYYNVSVPYIMGLSDTTTSNSEMITISVSEYERLLYIKNKFDEIKKLVGE